MTRSRVLRISAMLACLALGISACGDGSTAPNAPLKFSDVSAGYAHTCALTTTGVAYCWGSRGYGQLGDNSEPVDFDPDPHDLRRVAGNLRFTSLSAGAEYTCGLTAGGETWCWGRNNHGQLGNKDPALLSAVPIRASTLSFVSVTAGAFHTCGLTSAGLAYCWGATDYGILGDGGDGSPGHLYVPHLVVGDFTWAEIEASHFHTCGRTTTGAVYCWGGDDGRLGDGTIDNAVRTTPSRVGGEMALASLGTTHGAHLCGLGADTFARCWGFNDDGQLGDGTKSVRLGPVAVAGGLSFVSMAAGGEHFACGLTANGDAYCWGVNYEGYLGDGTRVDRLAPTLVVGGLKFKKLGVGTGHVCGLTTDADIYCWGDNHYGPASDPDKFLQPVKR